MKMQAVRVLAVLVFCGALGSAQTLTELLQKGIFAQDTLGDVDAAIRIYQQVIDSAPPASDLRAQAQRRLASAEARRRTAAANRPLATFDGRTYRHTATGLSFDVPQGWKVRGTGPSSDDGEMVMLSAVEPAAEVAVWMIKEKNDAESIQRKLQESPVAKARSRLGFTGYHLREGSIQPAYIGGERAMIAVADYTSEGRAMAEYMTWIYTAETHTFFFARVPAEDLEALRPQFDTMVHSAIIP